VQFGSWAFTGRAEASGLVPSMGSVGDCFDNSMIESFWSRMQVELLDRQSAGARGSSWPTRSSVPRDLAQPPLPAQRPGLDLAGRVREPK
jgi:transposase InsO family protein